MKGRRLARVRIPWALGLLAVSILRCANGNGWARARHAAIMLRAALGGRG